MSIPGQRPSTPDTMQPNLHGVSDPHSTKIASVSAMIEKYTQGLDSSGFTRFKDKFSGKRVVLVTGTTGNLGSQLLAELLQDKTVERVYAFNRPATRSNLSMLDRHKKRFLDKGLDIDLLASPNLALVEGDTASLNFGLSEALYTELRSSVTFIIHNAWRVHFTLPLGLFEPAIRGTRNLIDFARSGRHASEIRFMFVSSIAISLSWDRTSGPYPEEIVSDPRGAIGTGYGESKYVAERILAKSGVHFSCFRVNQITGGPPTGAWATSDWNAKVIISSVALKAVPIFAGVVSWLPVHVVAKAILETAFSPTTPPNALNISHPRPVPADIMFSWIKHEFEAVVPSTKGRLRTIPFADWQALLVERSKTATDIDLKSVPALRLLDFSHAVLEADRAIINNGRNEGEIGGWPMFVTTKAQEFSPSLKGSDPLTVDDAKLWIGYWNILGTFNDCGTPPYERAKM